MIGRPPRSTLDRSSAASDVYKRQVCRSIGIEVHNTLTGPELDALDDNQLQAAVGDTTVFARVSPAQKARVVEAQRLSLIHISEPTRPY